MPKETFEFCYLYVTKGVYCVNNVICIRRQMLGFSQQKVCEGICDVRTLRRIEQGNTRPRRETTQRLMTALGLPGEVTRTELVTDSQEARELMAGMRELVNAGRWEEAEQARRRIEGMVSMEILCNKQKLQQEEIFLKWRRGEIEDGEYLAKMKEVLELTLPYKALLQKEEIYLTGTEQICILHMMKAIERGSGEYMVLAERLESICRVYIDEGVWEGNWNMCELVMNNLESEWGNMGEYDKSDCYNEILLEGCLRFRRMLLIPRSTYERWWNHDMRKQKGIPLEKELDDEKELERCIQFSIMLKDKKSEEFLRRKLETKKRK